MLRRIALTLLLAAAVACSPGASDTPPAEAPASAPEAMPDHATLAEAAEMLELAADHYAQVGREQALADFTAGEAPFVDRDLYVFCYGPDRTISGHGADPTLIGVEVDELRDIDGKAFGSEIMEAGARPDGGTVEYHWANPVTGEVAFKVSVVRQLGEDICGVGAYRAE